MDQRSKIFKPKHSTPDEYFWLDYILLPYGERYEATRDFLKAKRGDRLRFFNGPEYPIERVMKIQQDQFCDMLCRMRYGIPWSAAFKKWQSYAVMEGHDKAILSNEYCLWVIYDKS